MVGNLGVRGLGTGNWDLGSGISKDLGFGTWEFSVVGNWVFGNWDLGGWELGFGNWEYGGVGDRELGFGNWGM